MSNLYSKKEEKYLYKQVLKNKKESVDSIVKKVYNKFDKIRPIRSYKAKLSNALYHLTGKGLPNRSKQQMELLDDLIDIHSEEYIANKLKSLFS
tara:strand:+ start:463 stop:744 length:282 start_codon:yes stop_codon:yes gene_type:complete